MIMKSMKRTGPGSKTRTMTKKNEARKAPPPQNGQAFTRTMKPMKRKGPGSKTRTLMKKNEAMKALPFFFFFLTKTYPSIFLRRASAFSPGRAFSLR